MTVSIKARRVTNLPYGTLKGVSPVVAELARSQSEELELLPRGSLGFEEFFDEFATEPSHPEADLLKEVFEAGSLTPREQKLVHYLMAGCPIREIVRHMDSTEALIIGRINRIRRKLKSWREDARKGGLNSL